LCGGWGSRREDEQKYSPGGVLGGVAADYAQNYDQNVDTVITKKGPGHPKKPRDEGNVPSSSD